MVVGSIPEHKGLVISWCNEPVCESVQRQVSFSTHIVGVAFAMHGGWTRILHTYFIR